MISELSFPVFVYFKCKMANAVEQIQLIEVLAEPSSTCNRGTYNEASSKKTVLSCVVD